MRKTFHRKTLQEKTQEKPPFFTLNYKENRVLPGFFPGVFFEERSVAAPKVGWLAVGVSSAKKYQQTRNMWSGKGWLDSSAKSSWVFWLRLNLEAIEDLLKKGADASYIEETCLQPAVEWAPFGFEGGKNNGETVKPKDFPHRMCQS